MFEELNDKNTLAGKDFEFGRKNFNGDVLNGIEIKVDGEFAGALTSRFFGEFSSDCDGKKVIPDGWKVSSKGYMHNNKTGSTKGSDMF